MANEAKRDEHEPGKMAYATPELKTLGSLYDITQGPVGGSVDGLFGSISGFPGGSPSGPPGGFPGVGPSPS